MGICLFLTHKTSQSIENRCANPNQKNGLPNIWMRFSESNDENQNAKNPKEPFQNKNKIIPMHFNESDESAAMHF